MEHVNYYTRCGEKYKSRRAAEERLAGIKAEHADTEMRRIIEGRGKFTNDFRWEVVGDDLRGYVVKETIITPD